MTDAQTLAKDFLRTYANLSEGPIDQEVLKVGQVLLEEAYFDILQCPDGSMDAAKAYLLMGYAMATAATNYQLLGEPERAMATQARSVSLLEKAMAIMDVSLPTSSAEVEMLWQDKGKVLH